MRAARRPANILRHRRSARRHLAVSIVFAAALGLLCYTALAVLQQPRLSAPQTLDGSFTSAGCVAWRHTLSCSAFGQRVPSGDRSCSTVNTADAGYCECEAGWTTGRTTCGRHAPFTCTEACSRLRLSHEGAIRLPAPLTCGTGDTYSPVKYLEHDDPGWLAAAAELQALAPHPEPTHNPLVHDFGLALTVLQNRRRLAARRVSTQLLGTNSNTSQSAAPAVAADKQAADLWAHVQRALLAAGPQSVKPPGARNNKHDFVRSGKRMSRADTQRARDQWLAFLAAAPAYPHRTMSKRGIVILSGSLPFMVPTWVNIHMLRRTGCMLPVEMWFPAGEVPNLEMHAVLARLGVTVRRLPDAVSSLSGFSMKAAALLLSGFHEVLFLDADNIPVRDPATLFDSAGYREAGAMLWPDYWEASAAPDVAAILQLPVMPKGTFESGQMIFDKHRSVLFYAASACLWDLMFILLHHQLGILLPGLRVWKGILLATFLNMRSSFYYPMLSNFMGQGDKETFAYALLAANHSYNYVPTAVGSVGIRKMHCNKSQRHCWHEFAGNTMTQHDHTGRLMFLHCNFKPKLHLELPDTFDAFSRRWQILQPGDQAFAEATADLHRDLEREVFEMLRELRCAAFLPAYVADQGLELPAPLSGFHPIHNGMDFRRPFRWGISGSYLRFIDVSMGDRWRNFKNIHIKGFFEKAVPAENS